MKIGRKEDMDVSDKMALLVVNGFGMARAEFVILRKARKNALICSLLWLEVSDCNGNGYEGGRGRCR